MNGHFSRVKASFWRGRRQRILEWRFIRHKANENAIGARARAHTCTISVSTLRSTRHARVVNDEVEKGERRIESYATRKRERE